MIGDGYFQLRAQIGTSLYSLTKLARDLAADEPTLTSLDKLQRELREPFLFLILGEPGVGKSTLLNALFGREFAGNGGLSGRTVTYRYGTEPHDEPLEDGSLEALRPYIFLRDFTLVELPTLGPSEPLTRLLPKADLVLVLLPAKGDHDPAWELLAPFGHEALRRCVFIVPRSDLLVAYEIPLVVNRLRHLMLTRLGHAYPIFPVSAWTRTGFDKLDRYLDGEIVHSPPRGRKLRELCTAGRAILDELGAQSRAAMQTAERQRQRLDDERLGLAARRDQSLRLAGGALWSLTRLFDSAHRRGAELLRRKLTVGRIWNDPPEWWREFHGEVEARLRETILRNLASAFEQFETDLQSAWHQHREVLRRLQLEGGPPLAHDGAALFARLAANLAACDPDGATTRCLQRAVAAARATLQLPAFAAGGAAAILLGSLAGAHFVPGAAAVAVFSATVLLGLLAIVRTNVLGELRRVNEGRRELVLARFEEEVRAEIDRFHAALATSFRPLEEAAARQRARLEPTLRRLNQLDELFARCTADIAAHKASLAPRPEG